MKKILLLLFCFPVFSQDYLEEVTKVFDNGKPMFIDYLDIEDLKKVKTTRFDELGNKIFSLSFNKETGLPDGEFFDLINKGYFDNGVLNCDDCLLVESNSPSVFTYNYDNQNTLITKGTVVNGRFIGKIEKYGYLGYLGETLKRKNEIINNRRYGPDSSSRFKETYTYEGVGFEKIPSDFIFYNQDGQIEGKYTKELRGLKITYNVVNGITKSYVSKDSDGLIVDSLSNDNKIWKINYKFRKNDGFILLPGFDVIYNSSSERIFYDDESFTIFPNEYSGDEKYAVFSLEYGVIPLGGNSINEEYLWIPNTGGKPSILDENGLYTIYNECLQTTYLKSLYMGVESYNHGDSEVYSNYSRKNDDCLIWKPSKTDNLFTFVYNYLVNDEKRLFIKFSESSFVGSGYRDNLERILNSDDESNIFKKYLKSTVLPEYLLSFFKENISISDYIKSIYEMLSSDKVEVQELYVWDNPLNKYVLVDFEKLIEIAEEKGKIINPDDYELKSTSDKNENIKFDWSVHEVWYTSDRNGDGEYVSEMESWVKNDEFITKVEQLGYKYDYSDKNTYYRVFLKDLLRFKYYKLNEGDKLITKDENELFIIFSRKN